MKNVFTNVTWKTLKKNRTRTLVTIIGILLAVRRSSVTLPASLRKGIIILCVLLALITVS